MLRNYFKLKIIFFFILIIFPLSFIVGQSDDLRPSAPPRIPIIDYAEEDSTQVLDFQYLSYDGGDDYSFTGYGGGYNYVSSFGENKEYGFNFGIGLLYLSGTDIEGGTAPISFNAAKKVINDETIIFGGLNYSFTYVYIDIGDGIDVSINQWGPQFGIKSSFDMSPDVKIIPYGLIRYDFFYIDIYVGDNYTYVEDDIASPVFGFDIEFKTFSIGSMLDVMNDDSLFTVNVSFKL